MAISAVTSWFSPSAWIGSARDGIIAGVAKSTPVALLSLKDFLDNVKTFDNITSLIEYLEALKTNPECSSISISIDSWIINLSSLEEDSDSFTPDLEAIKSQIIQTIDQQSGPAERLIANACQTAPHCIERSLQLLKNPLLNNKDLIHNLTDLLDKITIEEEKIFIREYIERLRTPETISIETLSLFLNKKNNEFSGPIAQNAARLGPIIGQGLTVVLHKLQEGLFDHGDPHYYKIYQCRTSIEKAFFNLQIPQGFQNELASLVEMLRRARPGDADFLEIFTQLELLLYPQESVEQSSLELLRKIDSLLNKLLQPQFFKRPGVLLNIFQLIAPFRTKNEPSIPLIEPGDTRHITSPPLHRIANFPANRAPLSQSPPPPPIEPVVVTPEELIKTLKSYLYKTKTTTLFQLTKWIGIDVNPPEEEERTEDFFKRVVAPLQTAGVNPIPTVRHFIVNLYGDISNFLIHQVVINCTPLFLKNLEEYFFAKSLDPIPMIKLTTTLKQTIQDLKGFSDTTLSREKFLKEKRFNRYSIRSSIALGWRLHKWTAQKITENIRLESLIEKLFTDIEVPFLKIPLNQLVSTLMNPINFLARKILFIGVRSFLSLIPQQTISNKILDEFLTQETLNKLYEDGLTSVLAQWESLPANAAQEIPLASAAQPEPIRIGPTRIDQNVVKDLLFSIVDMSENHKGIPAKALGKDILSRIPSPAQTYLFEEGTTQMAYAYDTAFNAVSHETIKANIRNLFLNAVEEPEPAAGEPVNIVELEDRLCKLLIKELFQKEGFLGTDGPMSQPILALTKTLIVTVRELVTEKELVKRIILDQLFLSA